MSEELKSVRADKHNSLALQDASPELRGDKDIVLAAVSICGIVLQHASEDLRRDKNHYYTNGKEWL